MTEANIDLSDVPARARAAAMAEGLTFPAVLEQAGDRVLRELEERRGGWVRGVFVTGAPGTGKTTWAVRLLARLRKRNEEAREAALLNYARRSPDDYSRVHLGAMISNAFVTDRGLIAELRGSMARGAESHAAVIARYASARLLVVDDLAAGGDRPTTDWEASGLGEIIDAAYQSGAALIVTSNRTLGDLAGILGPRIPSRLVEMAEVIALEGADRRLGALAGAAS